MAHFHGTRVREYSLWKEFLEQGYYHISRYTPRDRLRMRKFYYGDTTEVTVVFLVILA